MADNSTANAPAVTEVSTSAPAETVKLTQQQALNVLAQAVQVAQSRGAYKFKESALIGQALDVFMPEPAPEAAAAESTEESAEAAPEAAADTKVL